MVTTKDSNYFEKKSMTVLKSIEKAFSDGKPEREWILKQLAGLARAKLLEFEEAFTKSILRYLSRNL